MNDLDFNSLEFAIKPDNIFSQLREQNGLYPYQIPDGPKVWLATRREDVEKVLTEGAVFQVSPATANQSYQGNPFSEAIPKPLHLLAVDGAQHKRLRAPLEKFFTKEILEEYRVYINQEVENILKEWKKYEVIDLSSSFSYLIPVKIMTKMLGLEWNEDFPKYAISLQMVKAYPEDHMKNVAHFHQLLQQHISSKKGKSTDDIISVLLEAGLSDDEVLSVSLLLFIAGSGTTASLIIQGLREIISSGKAPSSDLVDKILFQTSPANSAFPRYVHEDYELAGTHLYKGDLVLAMLASANYDNAKGEDPLKNYFSFSKGIHHCIGWYLAKMEAEIAFNQFHTFFPKSKIIAEEWFSNVISRDIVSMKVKLA